MRGRDGRGENEGEEGKWGGWHTFAKSGFRQIALKPSDKAALQEKDTVLKFHSSHFIQMSSLTCIASTRDSRVHDWYTSSGCKGWRKSHNQYTSGNFISQYGPTSIIQTSIIQISEHFNSIPCIIQTIIIIDPNSRLSERFILVPSSSSSDNRRWNAGNFNLD